VGTSVAFFTDTSHVENELSFIGEKGIDAELTEPHWEPEKGLTVLPGAVIPKDPILTNTSEIDMDILAALRVEFVYREDCPDPEKAGQRLSDEDMVFVCDVAQIDWNADDAALGDWIRFDGEDALCPVQQFYYNTVLKRNFPEKGDETAPLFTGITIPEEVNNERYAHIQEIGGFDIRVTGKIVQQMTGDAEFGLNSAQEAYDAGLLDFETYKEG
jgi:hypothetical protein